jgi:hypothetical protein
MPRLLSLLLLCAAAGPLTGQSVRGQLTGNAAGAIVILVDSTGGQVTRTLASQRGSYALTARADGRYTVRVLRVGYFAWNSDPLDLAAGRPVELSTALPDEVVVLSEMDVSANGSCRADQVQGRTAATLLEEVGKAVGSAELALADRDLRFQVARYLRRYGRAMGLLAADSVRTQITAWPVHSLSAERLRDRGFVQRRADVDPELVPAAGDDGFVWFGPDAATIFSAPFVATHCFTAVADSADPAKVGLVFTVVRGRRLADIEGTLRVDRRTLAVERLEYHYVNFPEGLPLDIPRKVAGGSMDFTRLPTGLWVISQWRLKAPIPRYRNGRAIEFAGWQEEGGELKEVRTAAGAPLYPAPGD